MVETDPKFDLVKGACYVAIDSTHFVQVGGEMNKNLLSAAYMINLESISTSKIKYSNKYKMVIEKLPNLNIKRKYSGCTTGVIDGKRSIIVMGGSGQKESFLNSIEYLPLSSAYQNATELSTISSQPSDRVNFLTFRNHFADSYQWKPLPPSQIARSGFPTIYMSKNKLSIVGGKCTSQLKEIFNKVEVLNTEKCEWIFTDNAIRSTRYNHNSGDVSNMCH